MRIAARVCNIRFALGGLWLAFRTEQNIWIETAGAAATITLAALIGVPAWGVIFLITLYVLVLALELMNSAIERLADVVEPRRDPRIKAIKDLAAAAVFVPCVFLLPCFGNSIKRGKK